MLKAAAYDVINLEDCWPVDATWTGVPERTATVHVPTQEGIVSRRLANLRPNGAALLRLVGLDKPPKTEQDIRRQRIVNVLPDDDGHGIRFANDALRQEIMAHRIAPADTNAEIVRKREQMDRLRIDFRRGAQQELNELNDITAESALYVAFRHPAADNPARHLLIARLAGFDFDHNNHDFTMQPLVYGTVQMPQVEAGEIDVMPMRLPNPRDTIWPYVEMKAA